MAQKETKAAAKKEKPAAEAAPKEKTKPKTPPAKAPAAKPAPKKERSISDIVHKKPVDETPAEDELEEDSELEEAEEISPEETEVEDTDEVSDEDSEEEEAEEDEEAPAEEEAKPKKKRSLVQQLQEQISEMGKRHQSQIEALTNAIASGPRVAQEQTGYEDPASLVMSENPYLDRVFEDAVKGRFSDYDAVIQDFAAHAATKPELLNSIKALPAAQRFEQMYQAGLMLRFHKKYGTLHLPDIEKKAFEQGRKAAKLEHDKLIAEQRRRGAQGKGKQPTDTETARSSADDDSVEGGYRSPSSFSNVLSRVFGTA